MGITNPQSSDYKLFGIYHIDGYAEIVNTGKRFGLMAANLLGVKSKRTIGEIVERSK